MKGIAGRFSSMTWETLAYDIAARIEQDDREELFAQASELADAERATQLFVDRIRAFTGKHISISLRGPEVLPVQGQLVTSGDDWLLIRARAFQHLVMARSVTKLESPALIHEPPAGLPVTIGSMLRGIQGGYVTVTCIDSEHSGVLVGVGKDYLVIDLEQDSARRGSYAASWRPRFDSTPSAKYSTFAIPFSSLVKVSQAQVHAGGDG